MYYICTKYENPEEGHAPSPLHPAAGAYAHSFVIPDCIMLVVKHAQMQQNLSFGIDKNEKKLGISLSLALFVM